MRKKQQEIRVCDECGVPMIWTFAFDGAERYCLNCGRSGGMFGTGRDVPITRELIFQNKMVQSLWKILYKGKGMVPHSSKKVDCKKCSGSHYPHYTHMTKAEKEWDKIARDYLERLEGFLSPKETK